LVAAKLEQTVNSLSPLRVKALAPQSAQEAGELAAAPAAPFRHFCLPPLTLNDFQPMNPLTAATAADGSQS
jgi:hypothetical protein